MCFDPEVLQVIKLTAHLPVTDEQLMDAGMMPDTRPPVIVPWRSRLRWKLDAARERLGEFIAGRRFDE
jgi:hypothetical protein